MREFLKILRRFVPPYRKYLVGSIAFNMLSAVLNIFSFATIIPILNIIFETGNMERIAGYMTIGEAPIKEVAMNNLNYCVQTFVEQYGASTTVLLTGLFLVFMTFLKTGAYFLASAFIIPVRTGVVRDIRNLLYNKITSLSLGFFSEERKGDIIARMSGDVQEVEVSIMSSLDMLFKNPILIVIYFSTLVFISWQLTLFTLLFVPVFGWFMGYVGRRLKARSLQAQVLWAEAISQVEETLGGLRIVKAFCAEGKMNSRFDRVNTDYRNLIRRVNTRQVMAHPMSEFLGTTMIVVVLWVGSVLVVNYDLLSGPTFIYYMVILYSILQPLKDFSKASYNIPKGLASMERIDRILEAENSIREREDATEITEFKREIEFRDVSFRYGEQWVLRHINLRIPKGQTIAIVGQSGSGKSTMVDLIPRYYDTVEGQVLIDGVDVRDLTIHSLRSLIGNVNQEAILFNDSFRNNITFGVSSATDEEIVSAARIANSHEFIMSTEHGYDTLVGDRGGRLSGGQRQRVSIARAILKNPPILILDEATSALDTESERLVQDALEHLMTSRTTVAIAHRLSTIRHADRIYVLHEGQIVEQGTHDELIRLDGYYKKLHDMQA